RVHTHELMAVDLRVNLPELPAVNVVSVQISAVGHDGCHPAAEIRHAGWHVLAARDAKPNRNLAREQRVVRGTRQPPSLALHLPVVDRHIRRFHRRGQREALANEEPLHVFTDPEPPSFRRRLEAFFDAIPREFFGGDSSEGAYSLARRAHRAEIRRPNHHASHTLPRHPPPPPLTLHSDAALPRT